MTTTAGLLVLEDAGVFQGTLFGAPGAGVAAGEVVFNTAMCGYEEVLTDPSYRGQIVVMTSPHQGNYGITLEDAESSRPHLAGFVVGELSEFPSNWRAKISLNDYLKQNKIAGLSGVDTRALTLTIRSSGALRGAIIRAPKTGLSRAIERAVAAIKAHPAMEGLGLAQEVSVGQASLWNDNALKPFDGHASGRPRAAVWDFGVKWSILRSLEARGFDALVFPYQSTAREILDAKPQGIVLSNGPGDPAALGHAIGEIRRIIDEPRHPPVLGICLGHQLLGLACGGRTYKMKFGHHGVNHPVRDASTGRVWISSHNHGFTVDSQSLPNDVKVTHLSLNDRTVEGLACEDRGFISVQFHPESAPGPWEARGVFGQFKQMAEAASGR
ncbi:MAG: glutamine-hydrolyzing carbamoyl-phosphate synthase small subunit [Elusimicrobia bacterium]|nr:glutamine-hydrolyzing carbamoyl-phosphate synthase small subunit [Elusimicrobiota bacterium]